MRAHREIALDSVVLIIQGGYGFLVRGYGSADRNVCMMDLRGETDRQTGEPGRIVS